LRRSLKLRFGLEPLRDRRSWYALRQATQLGYSCSQPPRTKWQRQSSMRAKKSWSPPKADMGQFRLGGHESRGSSLAGLRCGAFWLNVRARKADPMNVLEKSSESAAGAQKTRTKPHILPRRSYHKHSLGSLIDCHSKCNSLPMTGPCREMPSVLSYLYPLPLCSSHAEEN
jgi:hypothetical protein